MKILDASGVQAVLGRRWIRVPWRAIACVGALGWGLLWAGAASCAETRSIPSFLQDVQPILTRYGCNSGGCHGKLAGQNGFRLSLRAFAPEWDFEWLARESRGRRLHLAAPDHSLLLRKSLGELPHGGGQRFEVGSRAHQTLRAWIAAGAPGPRSDEPALVALAVAPAHTTLQPGQRQPLTVKARYDDGTERDVTWLARFDAQDAGHLEVTADGLVRAARNGESIVRASFQGEVVVATITVPFNSPASPAWYAARSNALDPPVMDKLAALRLEPSPPCDDATFLRRAMLDTLGTLPTSDEVRAFLADPRGDKRQRLVDQLLERPEFNDYWALFLGDLFQNRRERDHDVRGVKGVRSFHAWLREQLVAHRPWDELVRELLTARGSATENPAVGYFIVTVGEKEAVESEVVDSVAQATLGTRVGCARCHNHPLERFTQDDYYHFAAFFSRVVLNRQAVEQGPTSLHLGTRHTLNLEKQCDEQRRKIADLRAPGGDDKALAEATQRLDELARQFAAAQQAPVTTAQPRTGRQLVPRPLDRSAVSLEPGADPRVALAAWITAPRNESFAGALVNRLWKHFFSVGLVEPVDDLRATNPPSNAELWRVLTSEFVAHRYDLRHVMRLILNSRTYQLAAETLPSNIHDYRFHSHYYPRRLPAEVLLDAICRVTDVPETFAGYPAGYRAIQIPDVGADSYFLNLFGRSARVTACACERDTSVTLPQLLHLQNGEGLVTKLAHPEGRLVRLLRSESDDARLVDELFLATLSRFPTAIERTSVLEALRVDATRGATARVEAASDLVWALLNSKEFTFNR